MKTFLLISICTYIAQSISLSVHSNIERQWSHFKETYQKSYMQLEEPQRFTTFEANLKKIEEHNKLFDKKEALFRMNVNQFADLTSQEFVKTVLRKEQILKANKDVRKYDDDAEIPDEIDWRELGAVTEVKDQGICAQWPYSLTGSLEGQNFIKTGKLIPLSEQELADCATTDCQSGTLEDGLNYVIMDGLTAAADYPGNGINGTCQRGDIPPTVTSYGYTTLINASEDQLKSNVALLGPIIVAVDATAWQFYSSGILSCNEKVSVNHGASVVGYGIDAPSDFWLMKNSWGVNWGESGYIKVARNSGGNCGVLTKPVLPLV